MVSYIKSRQQRASRYYHGKLLEINLGSFLQISQCLRDRLTLSRRASLRIQRGVATLRRRSENSCQSHASNIG